jgi:AcrR family transcriptional regulator
VEARVLGAALELLTEEGIGGTTMSAVIARSGVARATVYLRWPTRHALITAAIRQAMGRPIEGSTGDLERDLRVGAERIREVFSSPTFRSIFPELVAGLTTTSEDPDRLRFETVAPGAALMTDAYRTLAARQGFRGDLRPEIGVELLLGAQVAHYLMTGRPWSPATRDEVIEVVFDGLRVREQRRGA